MTETGVPQWETVDEGWGRRAVDFASLLEAAACREYVAMHHLLDIRPGERVLDIACGSGLAVELASLRGAVAAGIDASPRLIAIARDRVPEADLRIGDMAALPWDDGSFDVVTSFRGLWATTRTALAQARRVLRPGGRIAVTTWGHVKNSPGYWALAPFALAAPDKVRAQADMKSLGKPGLGEQILAEAGFTGICRHPVSFAWEFPDPDTFARALASTGPAHEAIQAVGEEEFGRRCVEAASARVRAGLPLRAEIDCVGFTARVPSSRGSGSLLGEAAPSGSGDRLAAEDLETLGFLSNVVRLWQHDPELQATLFDLIVPTARAAGLTIPERGVATIVGSGLVGDSYCPLAWGEKVAGAVNPDYAASVIRGSDEQLDARGKAIADWTRRVVTDPGSAGTSDIEALRAVGFDNAQILRLTLFIALRVAFSTVNNSLGARPEQEYVDRVSPQVRQAWMEMFG